MTDNDRMAQLERACSYLRRIPAWYLATTDVADGHQPRVRWQAMVLHLARQGRVGRAQRES